MLIQDQTALLSLKKISAETIPVVWAGGFLLLDDVSDLTLVHNHQRIHSIMSM